MTNDPAANIFLIRPAIATSVAQMFGSGFWALGPDLPRYAIYSFVAGLIACTISTALSFFAMASYSQEKRLTIDRFQKSFRSDFDHAVGDDKVTAGTERRSSKEEDTRRLVGHRCEIGAILLGLISFGLFIVGAQFGVKLLAGWLHPNTSPYSRPQSPPGLAGTHSSPEQGPDRKALYGPGTDSSRWNRKGETTEWISGALTDTGRYPAVSGVYNINQIAGRPGYSLKGPENRGWTLAGLGFALALQTARTVPQNHGGA